MYSLRGVMSFDGSAFERGLKQMSNVAAQQGAQIGASFSTAIKGRLGQAFGAGAIVGGFSVAMKSGLEYAANLKDLSEQHEMTLQEVQQISDEAIKAGLSFDAYANAISHFGQVRKKATEGDAEARAQLSQYGITLKDILDPAQRNIDLALKLGDALQTIKLTPQQRSELREIFGKSGEKIAASLPNISGGNSDLTDLEIANASKVSNALKRAGAKTRAFFVRMLVNPMQLPSADKPPEESGGQIFSTLNGKSDPLYFQQEAAHAEAMNRLYQRGLEIEMDKLGARGKQIALEREIGNLEAARVQEDDEEARKIQRTIEQKKLELQNLKAEGAERAAVPGIDLSERQRIGAYAGENKLVSVGERQLRTLQEILAAVRLPPKTTSRGLGFSF